MRPLDLTNRTGKLTFLKEIAAGKRKIADLFPPKFLIFSYRDTEPDKLKLEGSEKIFTQEEADQLIADENANPNAHIIWVEIKRYKDESVSKDNRTANLALE